MDYRFGKNAGLLVLGIPALVFAILLWSGKWWFLERARSNSPNIVQFTASIELDIQPSFSPDGSTIAYASDRSGGFEIYFHPVASGGAAVQITSDGQQNLEPSWSPNGQFIVYTSHGRKGIFVVHPLEGSPRRLTDFGSQPAWSPDGSQIVFRSDELSTPTNIWVVSTQGGLPRPLTRINNPTGAHSSPRWHPDGASILFVNTGYGEETVWSVRLNDGSQARLFDDKTVRSYPAYSRNGRHLYYVSPSSAGFSVWRQPLREGKPVEVLALGSTLPRDLTFDRSGLRLAYTETSGNIFFAELGNR